MPAIVTGAGRGICCRGRSVRQPGSLSTIARHPPVTSRRGPRPRGPDRSRSASRRSRRRPEWRPHGVTSRRATYATPARGPPCRVVSVRGRCRSRRRRRRHRSPTGRRTAARPVAAGRARQRRGPCRRRRGRRLRWPARADRLAGRSARRGRWAVRRRAPPGRRVARWWRQRRRRCAPNTANSSRHGKVTEGGSVPAVTYTKGRSTPSDATQAAGAALGDPRSGRIGRTTVESGRWPNETGNGWRYSCP